MFNAIRGKRVLITGASGGIGAAISMLFAEYGARLGLHYQSNLDKATQLCAQVRKKTTDAEVFQANLLDITATRNLVLSFIERFGGIDILINNAGATFDYTHFTKLDPKAWQDTFDLNVRAPFYLSGEVFASMQTGGGGRIINISSVNVKYGGSAMSMHYCAAKAALETLTVGFSREGAQYDILVNSIRCGLIASPMHTRIQGYTEEDYKRRTELVPLKRAGQPSDIASMVLYLASEHGNFITGEILTIAGGD